MRSTAVHSSMQFLAQPLGDGAWRVSSFDGHDLEGTPFGYIGEFGGTYEVRVIDAPMAATYVDTFKQAMECFRPRERAS